MRHREAIILPPRRVELNRAKYSAAIETGLGFHYCLSMVLWIVIMANVIDYYKEEKHATSGQGGKFMYNWTLVIFFAHCFYLWFLTIVYSLELHYNSKTPFQQRQLCRIDVVLLAHATIYFCHLLVSCTNHSFTWTNEWWLCHGFLSFLSLDLCCYSFTEWSMLPLPEMTHAPLDFLRHGPVLHMN